MQYYLLILGLVLSPISHSNDLISGFSWKTLPKLKTPQTKVIQPIEHKNSQQKPDTSTLKNEQLEKTDNKPVVISKTTDHDCLKGSFSFQS